MQWRIKSLIFIFGILYLLLIFNIYNLQIEKRIYYLNKVENQVKASGIFEAPRGNIYFSDKNNRLIPAALNREYPMIYAVPQEIQVVEDLAQSYAEKLSPILGFPVKDLMQKLSKPNDQYELLAEKANSEQINQVKKLNLKGIYIGSRPWRFYPLNELASHVLGFVGPADNGKKMGRCGLELYFEKRLSGKAGEIKNHKIIKAEAGEDLVLTIDPNIQARAEEILKNLIEKHRAIGGSVIVQEPSTGKILAMGSLPNFDPNNYGKFNIKKFLNPVVQAIYEPGSVFKVITMAAGIDSGKIKPETTYVDTGSVILNGKIIQNWDLKAHGLQTMTGVLENSINTGAVFAQRRIGPDLFYNYLIKFGFNEPTGIALPGEVKGDLNNLKSDLDIYFATASFGQGVAVTPIELINAISAIANDGILMKPIILANEKAQVIRRVISSATAKEITKMMVSTVEKNKIAVIPNYSLAGKTGTAFVPDFNKKSYTDKVINTYVGFGPASNPKFVILIKLDQPEGNPLAGQTVVPAFRELAQFILNYYNIAPDNLPENEKNS